MRINGLIRSIMMDKAVNTWRDARISSYRIKWLMG